MEAVHARQPRLPVLIMTAHGTIETAVERRAARRLRLPHQAVPARRAAGQDRPRAGQPPVGARPRAAARRGPDAGVVGHHGPRARRGGPGRGGDDRGRALRRLPAGARAAGADGERGLAAARRGPRWRRRPPRPWTKGMPGDVPRPATARRHRGRAAGRAAGAGRRRSSSRPRRGIEPTEDDLELLALFSSQAAVAMRNTHELERLRSGALAALGRMATAGRARAEEPAGRAAPLRAPPRAAAGARTATPTAPAWRRRSPRPSIIWPPSCRRSPPSGARPSCTACPPRCTRCSTSAWPSPQAACETPGVRGRARLRRRAARRRCSTRASCARRS